MKKLINIKRIIFVFALIFSLITCGLTVNADDTSVCASSRSVSKTKIEQVSEECDDCLEGDYSIHLHLIMIACLALLGGALGMVLLNTNPENSENNRDDG